jgi:hypothetical protein
VNIARRKSNPRITGPVMSETFRAIIARRNSHVRGYRVVPKPDTVSELRRGSAVRGLSLLVVVAAVDYIIVLVGSELAFLCGGCLQTLLSTRIGIADLQGKAFIPDRDSVEVLDNLVANFA